MTSHVKSGLDVLLEDRSRLHDLKGKRIACLVNSTAVNHELKDAIMLLMNAGLNVVKLFGPEHGIRGEAQDMEGVETGIDPVTKLPTKSLYGDTYESLKPTQADLEGVDLVIADIQDIGSRYYTYAYTIGLTMQACGQAGVPIMVLDRPNPINGVAIEGGIVDDDCRSFVGMQPLATRHGMTLGELARFFSKYGGWSADLEVVPMQGWRREMWFDETGLPWVMPSPNMPTLETAIVYPGQCILEGTTWSEGRGTTRPFELFGAPEVDAASLIDDVGEIEGARLRPVSFKPQFQKHAHSICGGVQLHITDRDVFKPVETTLKILNRVLVGQRKTIDWRSEAYEFVRDVPAIDLLLGRRQHQMWLGQSGGDAKIVGDWKGDDFKTFLTRRASVLLY